MSPAGLVLDNTFYHPEKVVRDGISWYLTRPAFFFTDFSVFSLLFQL